MEVDNLSTADFKHSEKTNIQCSEFEYASFSLGTTEEFERKDYSPAVFSQIRALDSISSDEYKIAIFGHETLRDVSLTMRPGTLLHLPHDDRFMIKTMKQSEVKALLAMLPNYTRHLKNYGVSLLVKYYGLHYVRPNRGTKVYFVVMANILNSEKFIHMRYDLKGSSQGRAVNKVEIGQTILKEMDLDFQFYLSPLTRALLLSQIKYDCEFLETEGIMDYSLLLGVHVDTSHPGVGSGHHSDKDAVCEYRTLSKEPAVKFGVNLPARAIRTPKESLSLSHIGNIRSPKDKESQRSRSVTSSVVRKMNTKENYNVFLYFGIIDLLQSYDMTKRLEHTFKSMQYDSKSISAINPKAYSSRFQEFLSTIFQDESDM